jgi:twinkle protein
MKTWADVGIELPHGASTGEVATVCPKCSSERRKNPRAKCLSANVTEGIWCCHHCGWAGSLKTRDEFVEPAWRKPRWRKPLPLPKTNLPPAVVEFFRARGISEAILARNSIGHASVYMPQLEDHAGVVVFPYFRGGELVNRKYRTRAKHFRMDTGAERILYGLDDVADVLVWVEGEIDKLSVEAAGIRSCVSVPDGAPSEHSKDYSSKFSFLETAAETLAKVTKHIIAVDSDAAGQRLEDELARRLSREKCWRVVWPEGCKDANEVLVKYGLQEVLERIVNAEPFPIEGVFTTLSEAPNVYALYRDGAERGYSTGWQSVDRLYTVRPGEFTVVTGIPSSGKSNWLDAMLVNLATLHGWSFGLFSPENQPIADHMARIVEKWACEPFTDGPTPRMSESRLAEGLQWAAERFFWVLPNDEGSWAIEWILARAKELVYRHGIRGFVIDPWNELEPQRSRDESETDYISRVVRTARQFARQHGVHLWIVVHPTKLTRGSDGRYPVPTLYDCSGSAHWRNKADNGICVWRDLTVADGATSEVEIHVQKIRFRQVGHRGQVVLHYDPPTATYSETAMPETEDRRFV